MGMIHEEQSEAEAALAAIVPEEEQAKVGRHIWCLAAHATVLFFVFLRVHVCPKILGPKVCWQDSTQVCRWDAAHKTREWLLLTAPAQAASAHTRVGGRV